MRLTPVFVLLAALCAFLPSTMPASAQVGDPSVECAHGILRACWVVRFGTCAQENPRVAIPACTRRLVSEINFFQSDEVAGGNKRRDQAQFYARRGNAYFKQRNLERALADYDLALKSSRYVYWIHANRGSVLCEIGEYQAELDSFDEAISRAPKDAVLLNARARLHAAAPDANVRNGALAISGALRAIDLKERVPVFFLDTLAAAYAENGEFVEAVEIQRNAIELLPPGDQDLIREYRSRLELYSQNMSFTIAPMIALSPEA
jgi:tetratricopeptide (TPR) repeat protein